MAEPGQPDVTAARNDAAADAGDLRQAAFERVLAYRARGRSRAPLLRILSAAAGVIALLLAVPAVIVLPELGIPLALLALRLLAVEAMWAARMYAWVDWRFVTARAWVSRQTLAVRVLIILLLVLVALALIWLLLHEVL